MAHLPARDRLRHGGRRGAVQRLARAGVRIAGRRRRRPVRHRARARRRRVPGPPPRRRAGRTRGRPQRRPDSPGCLVDTALPLPKQRSGVHRGDGRAGAGRATLGGHHGATNRRRGRTAAAHTSAAASRGARRRRRGGSPRLTRGPGPGGDLRDPARPTRGPTPYRLRTGHIHPRRPTLRTRPARHGAAPTDRQPGPAGAAVRGGPLPPAERIRRTATPAHRAVDRRVGHGLVGGVHHGRQPQSPDGVRGGLRPSRGDPGARCPDPGAVG